MSQTEEDTEQASKPEVEATPAEEEQSTTEPPPSGRSASVSSPRRTTTGTKPLYSDSLEATKNRLAKFNEEQERKKLRQAPLGRKSVEASDHPGDKETTSGGSKDAKLEEEEEEEKGDATNDDTSSPTASTGTEKKKNGKNTDSVAAEDTNESSMKKRRTFADDLQTSRNVHAEMQRKEKQNAGNRVIARRELRLSCEASRAHLSTNKELVVTTREDRRAAFVLSVEKTFERLQGLYGDEVRRLERKRVDDAGGNGSSSPGSPARGKGKGGKGSRKQTLQQQHAFVAQSPRHKAAADPAILMEECERGDAFLTLLVNHQPQFEQYEGPGVSHEARSRSYQKSEAKKRAMIVSGGTMRSDGTGGGGMEASRLSAGPPGHQRRALDTTGTTSSRRNHCQQLLDDDARSLFRTPHKRFFASSIQETLDSRTEQQPQQQDISTATLSSSPGLSAIKHTPAHHIAESSTGRSKHQQRVRDLSRPTISFKRKETYYSQTFFDENGASINVDREAQKKLPPIRPGYGYVSQEYKDRVFKKVVQQQLSVVRRKQREEAEQKAAAITASMDDASFLHRSSSAPLFSSPSSGTVGGGGGPNLAAPQSGSAATGYGGPKHDLGTPAIAPATEQKIKELLRGVFVKGGNVSTYLRKMEREAQQGLLRPDERRGNAGRLGGNAKGR